jgi:hypothetical protein
VGDHLFQQLTDSFALLSDSSNCIWFVTFHSAATLLRRKLDIDTFSLDMKCHHQRGLTAQELHDTAAPSLPTARTATFRNGGRTDTPHLQLIIGHEIT